MAKAVKNTQQWLSGTKFYKYISSIYYSVNYPASYSPSYYILEEVKHRKGHKNNPRSKIKVAKDVKRKFKRFKLFESEKTCMNMGYLEQYNKPYKYVLVAVDALSCFLRAEPLKTFIAEEMKSALSKMFRLNQPPNHYQTWGQNLRMRLYKIFLKQKV